MHKVCRLNDKLFYAVIYCSLKCLIHVVDSFIVSCKNVVDNNLCCESSSYRIVLISCSKCLLDSADILSSAVVKRCSEADYKDFLVTDLISVECIVLRRITCISSKVIRICFFTFNKLLLTVCKRIPCFLCFGALFISLIRTLLNIDSIDQLCNIISCCLIFIRSFGLNIRNRNLMVVPFSLFSNKCHIKLLINCRNGNIEAINFFCCSVFVSHCIICRLKELCSLLLRILCSSAEQI